MAKNYPEIGRSGHNPKWFKLPQSAPCCMAPGCTARATYRPEVEVNYFRGDDELCGPVCKEHSKDPVKLLEWTALRKAENKARLLEIERRKAEKANK